MRIGSLIDILSDTYGIPKPTCTVVARAMREAGLLTTGARGVNAPEMEASDVARLTLALLTGEPPSKVVAEYEFVAGLQTATAFNEQGFITSGELHEGHCLIHAITAIFDAMLDDPRRKKYSDIGTLYDIPPFVEISLDSSRRVGKLTTDGVTADYTNLAGFELLEELYASRPWTVEIFEKIKGIEGSSSRYFDSSEIVPSRGMRVIRTITRDEIYKICIAIKADQ